MKTLTLLRHAKSGWDDPVQRDVDRPLNPKGRRAAATVGRHLRREGVAFDHVVASPALRVQQTLEEVAGGYGQPIVPVLDRRIYMASAATLIDIIRGLPDAAASALLVGHNPGLEDLVSLLTSERVAMPTSALAVIALTGPWSAAGHSAAVLKASGRPPAR